MIVSTSLMIGDISESVASRSRSSTSSPCSVSLTKEMRKPEAASCNTRCVASQRQKLVSHHQVNRDLIEDRIVNWRILVGRQQIDKRQTVAISQFFRHA